MNLAKEVSTDVRLDAIDVSADNFPKDYPPNVHHSIMSVTRMPSDWTSSFDFVNQRMLAAALTAEEWPVAISEIFRVLKPGGSVQIMELDLSWPQGDHADAIMPIKKLYSSNGFMWDSPAHILDWLRAAGFTDVKIDEKNGPVGKRWGKLGAVGTAITAGAVRNMGFMFVKLGLVPSLAEVNERMDRIESEWDERQGMHYVYHVICAKKPL